MITARPLSIGAARARRMAARREGTARAIDRRLFRRNFQGGHTDCSLSSHNTPEAAEALDSPSIAAMPAVKRSSRAAAPRPFFLTVKERQNDLRRLVGDAQGLDAELLLRLQCCETGAFLGQVGVHEVADAGFVGIL